MRTIVEGPVAIGIAAYLQPDPGAGLLLIADDQQEVKQPVGKPATRPGSQVDDAGLADSEPEHRIISYHLKLSCFLGRQRKPPGVLPRQRLDPCSGSPSRPQLRLGQG
jgi:hypothetical protein